MFRKPIQYSLVFLIVLSGSIDLEAQINVRLHYNKGRNQLAAQEYTEAIRTFNLILQFDPEHAEALFYRGLAKYQLSDYTGAEADFTRAVEIKPYKSEALYYRGLLKLQKNQFLEAFRDIQLAIEVDDRHPEYFITRGWLHFEYGDTAGAIRDYNKAISLDPFLDNAYLNLATIYMQQAKYELAMSYCDSAETIRPRSSSLHMTRGSIYRLQEKYVDAIHELNEVLKRDSLHVRAWFFTALCHHRLGNYPSALEAYDKTINLNRDNALGYYNRGLLQLENEHFQKALDDFDQVVRLSPKNIYAYYIRGIIKNNLEDFPGAEEDFSTAIDLYPNLIHAYRNRSITRMAQDDIQGYSEDRNTVDSLLNIQVPGFDLNEISYLKTITEFNADFTPVERASESMVQYSQDEVSMMPVFRIIPRIDQYAQDYYRVKDLGLPEQPGISRLLLELKSHDHTSVENISAENLEFLSMSVRENPDDILLKSLILGWQMKYRDAIQVLKEGPDSLQNNYLSAFLLGNHNTAIAAIISSIESRDIYSGDASSTVLSYYNRAIEAYEKSIELNPDFAFSRYNLAYVMSYTENLVEALAEYKSAIELNPSLGEAYYNSGLIQLFMNFNAGGCRDLSKAGELGIDAAYKAIYQYCNE